MKRFKIVFLVAILAVAIGASAFYTAPAEQQTSTTVLYWFDEHGNYLRMNTFDDELIESPCKNETFEVCERGYDQNDLINPSNPSQGVKSTATVEQEIFKNS